MNANDKQNIAILGATGSIGVSTLSVVAQHPQRFGIFALVANRDVDRLFSQCMEFTPRYAVMADATAASVLRQRLKQSGSTCEVLEGAGAIEQVASHPEVDSVMAAIVGAAGLRSTLAAANAGKKVMLANKESLVMAGDLLVRAVNDSGGSLLPIDSEHNAIFQALPVGYKGKPAEAGIRRLMLTASGGPFRLLGRDELGAITPDQACAHPNWVMGRKISVDSATLMNKGLEVIEAHHLFNVKPDQIDVVIHPESVVHSLVEYIDGSVIAQLGNPDMRTPIAYALAYPERIEAGVAQLDLPAIGRLRFEAPDFDRFPCLRLAYQALRADASSAVYLNAANEVAVARFLDGRLAFDRIADVIEDVINRLSSVPVRSLDEVIAADHMARRAAEDWVSATVH